MVGGGREKGVKREGKGGKIDHWRKREGVKLEGGVGGKGGGNLEA